MSHHPQYKSARRLVAVSASLSTFVATVATIFILGAPNAMAFDDICGDEPCLPEVVQIKATALPEQRCNSKEWHFVITKIDNRADAPETVRVKWDNGNVAYVPLDRFTGHKAHYTIATDLRSTVRSAKALIIDTWSGRFFGCMHLKV